MVVSDPEPAHGQQPVGRARVPRSSLVTLEDRRLHVRAVIAEQLGLRERMVSPADEARSGSRQAVILSADATTGHVAIVESVNGNTVHISEQNFQWNGVGGLGQVTQRDVDISDTSRIDFIS